MLVQVSGLDTRGWLRLSSRPMLKQCVVKTIPNYELS